MELFLPVYMHGEISCSVQTVCANCSSAPGEAGLASEQTQKRAFWNEKAGSFRHVQSNNLFVYFPC